MVGWLVGWLVGWVGGSIIFMMNYYDQSQKDAFLESAERHLGALGPGKVKWTAPSAGMFVWLDLSGACASVSASDLLSPRACAYKRCCAACYVCGAVGLAWVRAGGDIRGMARWRVSE